MKRQFPLIALLLCTAFSTLAVPVTFQLDLQSRIDNAEFIPGTDQIVVRGTFNDWSGNALVLAPSEAGSAIYTTTTDVDAAAGSTVEFKFVQVRPGTDDIWESTPNRAFIQPSTAIELPVSYFNNVWDGAAIPVRFQVNMATQQAANAFNPANGDFVEVRGTFNNWSSGVTFLFPSAENPDIYEAVAEVFAAPGSRVEYKFVIVRVTPETTVDIWENDPNRFVMQPDETQDLPVVYFNNVTGVPVKAAINFAVDMNVYLDAGLLDTNTQQVYIRGNKVGWGNPPAEGLQLLEDAARPGIFTNTYSTDGQITGDVVEYKTVIWTPETAIVTWESGANKSLTFTGTEPKNAAGYHELNVGPVYFDGLAPGSFLNEETVVTFRVDMNNARTLSGDSFNPATDTVALNGAFLPGGWQPWDVLFDTQAFDDGVSGGDTTAGDGIYTVQVTLPRGAPARLVYKYGINAADNEAAIGNDRVRYVRSTGTYSLPVDTFGDITQESETLDIGTVSIARGNVGEVTLSWEGQPGVRLQKLSSLSGGTVTDLPATDGQNSYTVQANENMAFFRLMKP
jgi:hypothetical protein